MKALLLRRRLGEARWGRKIVGGTQEMGGAYKILVRSEQLRIQNFMWIWSGSDYPLRLSIYGVEAIYRISQNS